MNKGNKIMFCSHSEATIKFIERFLSYVDKYTNLSRVGVRKIAIDKEFKCGWCGDIYWLIVNVKKLTADDVYNIMRANKLSWLLDRTLVLYNQKWKRLLSIYENDVYFSIGDVKVDVLDMPMYNGFKLSPLFRIFRNDIIGK